MDAEDRQFMLTCAWLFSRHGQRGRAKKLFEALVEEEPQDGVSAIALSEILLEDGEAKRALETIRAAVVPPTLGRARAMLETRSLHLLGRKKEAILCWKRYVDASNGRTRTWVN